MASPRSGPGSGRRPGKNVSVSLPLRTAHDPLEVTEDPLANSPSQQSLATESTDQPPDDLAASVLSLPGEREASAPIIDPDADLGFILAPGNYHAIPLEDVPGSFLDSPQQPPQDTPLDDLLRHGHFRRGAEAALSELLQASSHDVIKIMQLLYTRLACLVLISRADLAAHESAPLTDYLSHEVLGSQKLLPLIPWELRLLLVRLQTIAGADGGRRSIMGLYSLAGEVRTRIKDAASANDQVAVHQWSDNLRKVGLRVADTLVEMGELETAARHLDTLTDVEPDELAYRKVLLQIRVGDIRGARSSLAGIQNTATKVSLEALLDFTNGETHKAVARLETEAKNTPNDPLTANNLGVVLLYSGQISRARNLLEELGQESTVFSGLLFNLSTVYELCSERAGERKMELAQQMAAKTPMVQSGGWERVAFELKL